MGRMGRMGFACADARIVQIPDEQMGHTTALQFTTKQMLQLATCRILMKGLSHLLTIWYNLQPI